MSEPTGWDIYTAGGTFLGHAERSGDVTNWNEAMAHVLGAILNPDPQPGPPYVHTFAFESEPVAVITRRRRFLREVEIRHGIMTLTTDAGWPCLGRRWAESKARRELRKYKRPAPPTYTITR